MLSRLTARAVSFPRVLARCSSSTATPVTMADGPERDLVNFPRRKRPIHPGKVRHLIIPEEFFQMLHSKTGVTGPYMFFGSLTTYLVSKEIFVLEHEFYGGVALAIVMGGLLKYAYPIALKYYEPIVESEEAKLKAIRQDEIDKCDSAVADEENAQWMATSHEEVSNARKENVALQLEAAYRARMEAAFSQVKMRLDYQLELSNVMRNIEHKHMVNWIIGNVRKSITPKQEDEALKKCIADLKGLA